MQAIILAAGRGTRMGELSNLVPKPMLLVNGKSLIEHKLEALPPEVDEVIFVIGHLGHIIRDAFGDTFNGKKLRYVEQTVLDGTMGAVALAKPYVNGRFVVMMGDDLYGPEDVRSACATQDWVMVVEETESMASGGKVVIDEHGLVVDIEEGDHRGTRGFMNTNLLVLDERVFDCEMIPKSLGSDEYGLPQTVMKASHDAGIPLRAVRAKSWIQVTAPEDIARAEGILNQSPLK